MGALLNAGKLLVLAVPLALPFAMEKVPLHQAAARGDVDGVRRALRPWKDVNGFDHKGQTPLMLALQSGKPEAARYLIERGALTVLPESGARQPFDRIVNDKDNANALFLLKRGQDPNTRTSQGVPWLIAAINRGDAVMVDALLEARADPNLASGGERRGSTPIAAALRRGTGWSASPGTQAEAREQALQLAGRLLRAGARLDGSEENRQLMREVLSPGYAATPAPYDTARLAFMIENGYPLTSSEPGNTPLADAAGLGNAEAVRFLIAKGADPNGGARPCGSARCEYVRTPLQRAIQSAASAGNARPRYVAAIEALVAAGADVNLPDRGGTTPVMDAAKRKDIDTMRLLLQAGGKPSPEYRDVQAMTAAALAADRGGDAGPLRALVETLSKPPVFKAGHPDDPKGTDPNALLSAIGSDLHVVFLHHAGGPYSGNMTSFQEREAGQTERTVELEVTAPGEAITLILTNQSPANWRITAGPASKVRRIFVFGEKAQKVSLAPPGAQVLVYDERLRPATHVGIEWPSSASSYERVLNNIVTATGVRPKTMYSYYGADRILIDGVNNTELVMPETRERLARGESASPDSYVAGTPVVMRHNSYDGLKMSGDGLTLSRSGGAGPSAIAVASRSFRVGKRYVELVSGGRPESWTNFGYATGLEAHGIGELLEKSQLKKLGRGDRVGVAFDFDNRRAYVRFNGAWITGAPESGNGRALPASGPIHAAVEIAGGDSWKLNFGKQPFADPLPVGYLPYDDSGNVVRSTRN